MLRGGIVFDTFRTYGARPFRRAAHLARLERSAEACDVPMPSLEVLLSEVERVVGPDHWVRITLTAGGNRAVEARPIDVARVGRPVRCATVEVHPNPALPGFVKHGSRLAWSQAAKRYDVDEVVFVDPEGFLLEANRSSLFAVVGGALVTPPADDRILMGVTRQALIDAAGPGGVEVRPLHRSEPLQELYLASTLKELAPVAALDGQAVGGGPVGKSLQVAFRSLVAGF